MCIRDSPWCDDFSAAKNFAIEKASHSYVLVLDSDEFVEQLDLSALEKQIAAHPGAVGRIRRRNVFHRNGEEQENREWINRIFAKEYFHYEGRIHEQVTPCLLYTSIQGEFLFISGSQKNTPRSEN